MPDDNPIKGEILRGPNYRSWSNITELFLRGKGLWDLVDGSEEEPEQPKDNEVADLPTPDDPSADEDSDPGLDAAADIQRRLKNARHKRIREEITIIKAAKAVRAAGPSKEEKEKKKAWDKKAGKTCAIILSHVAPSLRGDIIDIRNPKTMWDRLKTVYQKTTFANKTQATSAIAKVKFRKGDDPDKFFSKLQDMMADAADLGAAMTSDDKNQILLESVSTVIGGWVESYIGRVPLNQLPATTMVDIKKELRRQDLCGEGSDEDSSYYARRGGRGGNRGRGRGRGRGGGGRGGRGGSDKDKEEPHYGPNYGGCYECGGAHKARDCFLNNPDTKAPDAESEKDRKLLLEIKARMKKRNREEDKDDRSRSRSPAKKKSSSFEHVRSSKKDKKRDESHHTHKVNTTYQDITENSDANLSLQADPSEEDHFDETKEAYVVDTYDKSYWRILADCGSTDHMFTNKQYFINMKKLTERKFVKVGGGHLCRIVATGSVLVHAKVNGQVKKLVFHEVCYIPTLGANLLSNIQLGRAGYTTVLEGSLDDNKTLTGKMIDMKTNKILFTVTTRNSQYELDVAHDYDAMSFACELADDSELDTMANSTTTDENTTSSSESSDESKRPNRLNAKRRRAKARKQQRTRKSRKERHSARYKGYNKQQKFRVMQTATDYGESSTNEELVDTESSISLPSEEDDLESATESSDESDDSTYNMDIAIDEAYVAQSASTRQKAQPRQKTGSNLGVLPKCPHGPGHEDTSLYETVMHHRLGHPHHNLMKTLGFEGKKVNLKGTRVLKNPTIEFTCCRSCIEGRGTVVRTKRTPARRTTAILDMIHMDLVGPISPLTKKKAGYFLVIVDDYSRLVTVSFLNKKSETPQVIENYKKRAELQTGKTLKGIKTDNGTEFINDKVKDLCTEHGMFHDRSAVYTSRQAGVSERHIRTLVTKARCLLYTSAAPLYLWDYAVLYAAWVMNRLPSEANEGRKSPYEMWNDETPDLRPARVWGCDAYHIVDKKQRKGKFGKNAVKCAFVGIAGDSSNYLLLDAESKRIFASASVKFDEMNFSVMEKLSGNKANGLALNTLMEADTNREELQVGSDSESAQGFLSDFESSDSVSEDSGPEGNPTGSDHAFPDPPEFPPEFPDPDPDPGRRSDEGQRSRSSSLSSPPSTMSPDPEVQELARVRRQREREARLREQLANRRRGTRPLAPNSKYPSTQWKSFAHKNRRTSFIARQIRAMVESEDLPAKMNEVDNPDTYQFQDAYSHPTHKAEWHESILDEFNSISENKVWELHDLKEDKKPVIGCRWVFKVKTRPDGTIFRHKSRLVARGFTQRKGVNFNETFAPVAKYSSLRLLFAMASDLKWKVHQLDAKTAFLCSEVDNPNIFVELPEGFVETGQYTAQCKAQGISPSSMQRPVLRLRKALYGLRQSPRLWYQRLTDHLKTIGFTRSELDHSVWAKEDCLVAIYVDDILTFRKDEDVITKVKDQLKEEFKMVDSGEVEFFLGLQVRRDKFGYGLTQSHYIEKLLKEFNMDKASAVPTPITQLLRKRQPDDKETDIKRYQRAVGSLMYLMLGTRPDIAFAISHLSQFCSNPSVYHWAAVKRLFRYLIGTKDEILWLNKTAACPKKKEHDIYGYTDADWAADTQDRKSVGAYLYFFRGSVVSWASKKQTFVATSSMESEYVSASIASKEGIWLREFVFELNKIGHLGYFAGLDKPPPVLLLVDNQAAIRVAENPEDHQRSKHIDISYHFLRQRVALGHVVITYVNTKDQVADYLTKCLQPKPFLRCRFYSGIKVVKESHRKCY